jgi:hypothetical protein
MLSKEHGVQVCDATKANSSNIDRLIIFKVLRTIIHDTLFIDL